VGLDAATHAANTIIATSADVAADVTAQFAEKQLALAASWWPADFLLRTMQAAHDSLSVPWFATIIGSTVAIRIMIFPLVVKMMRGTSKMAWVQPELKQVNEYCERHNISTAEKAEKIKKLWKKHDVNPFAAFGMMFLQMPIFMSFFFALKKSPEYFPEMASEGALWFTDLTAKDPVLAATCAVSFLLTIELGTDGQNPNEQTKTMKNVMRLLGVAMIPAAMQFPAALSLYWNANNTYSLLQTLVLNKVPFVKPALGILPPPPPEHLAKFGASVAAPAQDKSFMEQVQEMGGGGKGADGFGAHDGASAPFASARNAVQEREARNLSEEVMRGMPSAEGKGRRKRRPRGRKRR
jgi:YidC/Oxa1 family membrane protein insertase